MQNCINCFQCQMSYGGANQPQPAQKSKLNHLAIWNTNRCNCRCVYCFVFERTASQPNSDITNEVIDALPAFYEKYYDVNASNFIYFFGGEPLAAFDKIQQVYERMKQYKTRWSMTSNMTLLNDAMAAWLGERGFHMLCSIDGVSDANEARLTIDGRLTWYLAMRGLKLVRKHMQAEPELRMTITPQNVSLVYDSFIFFAEQGFSSMAAECVYEVPWSASEISKLVEEYTKVAEFITHHRARGYSYKPLRDTIALLNNNQQKESWKNRCGLGQTGVAVDTDGSLYPCHRFVCNHDANIKLGDVFDGINEAARAKVVALYSGERPRNVDNPDKCYHCLNQRMCNGGCLSVNVDTSGKAHLVPNSYCDIQHAIIKALLPYAVDNANTLVGAKP